MSDRMHQGSFAVPATQAHLNLHGSEGRWRHTGVCGRHCDQPRAGIAGLSSVVAAGKHSDECNMCYIQHVIIASCCRPFDDYPGYGWQHACPDILFPSLTPPQAPPCTGQPLGCSRRMQKCMSQLVGQSSTCSVLKSIKGVQG
jgi:hypothetical protein